MQAPFNELADSDAFELLVYDLLEAEGFRDVCWRGPGADGGRDIEATWTTADPVGGSFHTKWYIECKWYTDSVPFSEIEPKLLAATAFSVDYLLVATSSRVRNTAMDSIAHWLDTRGQPFRIRYWTGADIVRLAVRHSSLFRKHFPRLSPPTWSDAESDRQRLSVLLGTSSERLAWRVIPAVQLLLNRLPATLADITLRETYESDLDFIASMLRAHDAFSLVPSRPSVRSVLVADCVRAASRWLMDRGKSIDILSLDESCLARASAPLLKCALFELILNAAAYRSDGVATMKLTATAQHWIVEIVNTTNDTVPDPWPLIGYRSRIAKQKHPSGQGLGCWLVAELSRTAGFDVTWSTLGGAWTARLRGACA